MANKKATQPLLLQVSSTRYKESKNSHWDKFGEHIECYTNAILLFDKDSNSKHIEAGFMIIFSGLHWTTARQLSKRLDVSSLLYMIRNLAHVFMYFLNLKDKTIFIVDISYKILCRETAVIENNSFQNYVQRLICSIIETIFPIRNNLKWIYAYSVFKWLYI